MNLASEDCSKCLYALTWRRNPVGPFASSENCYVLGTLSVLGRTRLLQLIEHVSESTTT